MAIRGCTPIKTECCKCKLWIVWIDSGLETDLVRLFMCLVICWEGYVFKQLLFVEREKPIWRKCLSLGDFSQS